MDRVKYEELKAQWKKHKPETKESMIRFLNSMGFNSKESADILKKAGITFFSKRELDKVDKIADIAIKAGIVPQILRFLKDKKLSTESVLRESLERLTDAEVRSIIMTLLTTSSQFQDSFVGESILKLVNQGNFQVMQIRLDEIVDECNLLTERECATLSTIMIMNGWDWNDFGYHLNHDTHGNSVLMTESEYNFTTHIQDMDEEEITRDLSLC